MTYKHQLAAFDVGGSKTDSILFNERGEQTVLCDLLEKQCGEPIREHFIELYRGERPYIATFAHTVFEARAMGDPVACAIFDEGARDLAEIAQAAARRLGKPFDLVLNGGIFTTFPEYARAVGALCPPEVNIVYSDVPPIYGGAVEAMYEMGLRCGEDFRAAFLAGWDKAPTVTVPRSDASARIRFTIFSPCIPWARCRPFF